MAQESRTQRVGFTQKAFAEELGITQAAVTKLENGIQKLTVSQLLNTLDACDIQFVDVADEIDTIARVDGRPLWERIDE